MKATLRWLNCNTLKFKITKLQLNLIYTLIPFLKIIKILTFLQVFIDVFGRRTEDEAYHSDFVVYTINIGGGNIMILDCQGVRVLKKYHFAIGGWIATRTYVLMYTSNDGEIIIFQQHNVHGSY